MHPLPQSSYSCPVTIVIVCQLISGERRDVLLPYAPSRSPEGSVLKLSMCGVFTAGMRAGPLDRVEHMQKLLTWIFS